jgi:uncharacterized protein
MTAKKTLVLGASENPNRYSFLALKSLSAHGHPVVAVGKVQGSVDGININKEIQQVNDIHTITMYLNPTHQKQYYDYILSLNPKRVIFNPGAENSELASLCRNNNIEVINGCTLVMLSTSQF